MTNDALLERLRSTTQTTQPEPGAALSVDLVVRKGRRLRRRRQALAGVTAVAAAVVVAAAATHLPTDATAPPAGSPSAEAVALPPIGDDADPLEPLGGGSVASTGPRHGTPPYLGKLAGTRVWAQASDATGTSELQVTTAGADDVARTTVIDLAGSDASETAVVGDSSRVVVGLLPASYRSPYAAVWMRDATGDDDVLPLAVFRVPGAPDRWMYALGSPSVSGEVGPHRVVGVDETIGAAAVIGCGTRLEGCRDDVDALLSAAHGVGVG